MEEEQRKAVEEFENIRKNMLNIKDNVLRRRIFMAHNTNATITPRLAKILDNLKFPKEFINNVFPQDDLDKFLDKLPTALCEFTLLFQRDQLLQRPIKVNDINDIWHLTLVIPYSDIIVTEKMWSSRSRQVKIRSEM